MPYVAPLPSAFHTSAGKKPYQQDRAILHQTSSISLFAVADGHGSATNGHTVSSHIACNLIPILSHFGLLADITSPTTEQRLHNAVLSLDEQCLHATRKLRVYAGSTLCLVLIDRQNAAMVVANVGDSRAVLVRKAGSALQLSNDHVPELESERVRIEENGGWVVGNALNGYITMSRAMGDEDLKDHRNLTDFSNRGGSGRKFGNRLFVAEPEVARFDIKDGDLAVVVGSDGVWGGIENHKVGELVMVASERGNGVDEVARKVVKKAGRGGSRDNCTCVIVGLEGGIWEGSDGSPRDIRGGGSKWWRKVGK